MAEINPYESPRCPEPPVAVGEPAERGSRDVWLKGVHPNFLDQLPVWPYTA